MNDSSPNSDGDSRPLVSIVLPAFNEAAIVEENLNILYEYLSTLDDDYRWEILFVNDGSSDATAELAEGFAAGKDNMRVFHHVTNFGLGQAFKTAFAFSRGDYVVTLDIDLSYTPDHIERLLTKIRESKARMVLASPYMEGGKLSNVPALRRFMSIWANRFLSFFSYGKLSTLTCMVRAYEGHFARSICLRSMGMDVMPEMVYKSMILRGKIEQVPAHLDWGHQLAAGPQRRSSMKILRHILSTLLSGFILRPFLFFIVPGSFLLAFSLYVNAWMVIHFFEALFTLPENTGTDPISAAIAQAYAGYPHTFIVGLLSLMLAVQLVSLGILALQSKNYFEEIFYLGSKMYRAQSETPVRLDSPGLKPEDILNGTVVKPRGYD